MVPIARNIPDLFRAQTRSSRGVATAKMASISHEEDYSEESQSASADMVRDNDIPDHPLSYSDM